MARNSTDYETEDELPVMVDEEKVFSVTFNQNRSFELKIGRKWFFFEPYSSETLTQAEINHPDFKQQSGYFNIKEL